MDLGAQGDKMLESFCYDDILLVPQYSDIESRYSEEIDIRSDLKGGRNDQEYCLTYDIPIIASPMDKVISPKMCQTIGQMGGLSILHRFNTPHEQSKLWMNCVKNAHLSTLACAIGTRDWQERVRKLADVGCCIFCVDVAHGHHINVKRTVEGMRNLPYGDKLTIIAGSVATPEAYKDLIEWGADAVRVGIGTGAACTTRTQTGHGVPGLHSISECVKMKKQVGGVVIADGGIKNSGDIAKALAAGADFVMLGKMLAATSDSPSDLCYVDGKPFKEYRGMFSYEAQKELKKEVRGVEGVSGLIPYTGETLEVLENIQQHIKSALSYSGARSLKEFEEKSVFVRQTSAGMLESQTHVRQK